MESPLLNPVTICIAICVALFLSFGIQIGATAGEIFLHIFMPYLVDISRGVGKQGAFAFRGVALIIQLGVIGLAVARSVSKEKSAEAVLSTFGILLTIVYFVLIAVAYLLPRLH